MKQTSLFSLALLCMVAAGSAQAHGDFSCDVPKAEWKTQMELQRKLTAEGWKIRQVKTDNGCYEVYGFDEKGQRIEIYFNPKTFEKVGEIKQPS
ncbi:MULTISPECIES: PepSY domain-containing protein [Polaromonas]|uniref:PepSY domain-containing protein n=1 Tax=Polaromonas aquatica TaxID=332657 RepID=A0ABW1U4C4_9BURK